MKREGKARHKDRREKTKELMNRRGPGRKKKKRKWRKKNGGVRQAEGANQAAKKKKFLSLPEIQARSSSQ
jgi:hypothetical protein